MRKLSKILVLVLVLMTVLTAVSAMTASALSVRISGSWNGWGTANNTTLVDNLYIHKVDLAVGSYQFKVVEGSTWMGKSSTFTNSTTNASFTSSGGNATLKVTTAGTFIFQWNASTNQLTIVQHSAHSLEVDETPATCTVNGHRTEKCTVVGCGYNAETVLQAQGHAFAEGVCTVCGEAEPTEHVHFFVSEVTKAPTCTEKGELTWTCACGEDSYTTEAEMIEHAYKFGACSVCGSDKPGYTYYLEGYINNADYTGTKYAFVDGKLTINAFTAASYVYVVDSDGNRFMTSAYSTKTSDTFVTTGAEKMLVPTGFDELTFTIVNNKNGTVTLSYEGKSNCNHNWADATCQKAKHCTVCGELDGAVINHYYWDGKCQWCDSTITEWVTVYVNNVANWSTVNFYAWSNTTTIGTYMSWPGTAMVKNEDGLFVAQIPAQYENIIFNNGSVQSADLKVPTNSKVIFNNSANSWSCLHTWVDATCTAPKTCSGCGITEGEALGHTPADTVEENRVEATCTEKGHYDSVVYCSVCKAELSREEVEIPVIAHTEETVAAKDPTCTKTGLTEGKKCSVCGEILVEQTEVPALGHDIVADEAKAPTCTETGLTAGEHCSRCDGATVTQEEVPALGHDIVADEAKAPTCTETGLTAGEHCSRCDGATVAQEEVPALGHDIVADEAKAPTCTETGLTAGEHCSRCDHKVAQEEVPALGHTFVDGKCECGAEDPDYVAPQPEPELSFFQKIIAWFMDLINKLLGIFKK